MIKNNINKDGNFIFTFLFFFLFIFADVASAASFEDMVNKIVKWLDSSVIKGLATIAIIAIGIYVIKNIDRWREIMFTCGVLIIGLMVLMNASTIANWLTAK